MPKQVPKTKCVENKGVLAVARFANEIGWTWRDNPNPDYGIDGELEPSVDGKPTAQFIKVQVRSGSSYLKNETAQDFVYLVSDDDLEYWDRGNVPVLLAVHDPRRDRTYFADIQARLKVDPSIRLSRRIAFDKQRDLLDGNSEATLIAAANDDECTGRIFRKPSRTFTEEIQSNLFPARSRPRLIYSAATEYRTPTEIRNALGTGKKTPCIPLNERLYTFADLNDANCSLRAICDTSSITPIERTEWEADEARCRNLVWLMNVTLRKMLCARGLEFDRDGGRYYFPPEHGGSRIITYQSLVQKRPRPVAYPHVKPSTGEIDYWVHWAVRFRFMQFGQQWYLNVEPCMVFTRDGTNLVGGEEMGRLSTKRSSHCYNRNVLGFLYFWKDFLSQGTRVITVFPPQTDQLFDFWRDFVVGRANFGIEGDRIEVLSVEEDLDEIDLSLTDDEPEDDDLDFADGEESGEKDEPGTEA